MTMRSVTTPTIHGAQAHADSAVNTRGFELFARGGFVARGVVYGIIGVLALELALGDGGRATNQQGALATVAHQSFGHVLLIAVAIGLGGYAALAFRARRARPRPRGERQHLRPRRGIGQRRGLRRACACWRSRS